MSDTPQAAWPPIWPQPIPIIAGTGDKWAGKTKFGLNIFPGKHTTLVFDLEQSSASYEGVYRSAGVPFDRVDVQKEMHKKHPNGYKPIDLFVWWLGQIRSVPTNKYAVIMVDPVTDLERGLSDYVAANPKMFGHTEAQYASMSGIMWGDVKDFEKMLLADITARCQTFYFTAHIGAEFQGKTATGKKKVKGKETLYELASLFLWFDRGADATGARPNVPGATVMKSRLEVGEFVNDELKSYSVLPPRLPVATPKAIRDYFLKPAGKVGLNEAEKVKEEKLTDDQRLILQAQIAEAQREAAVAHAAAAQAQQVTVVLAHAPPEDKVGDPAAWETSYGTAIDKATTVEEIQAIPPQIKISVERKHFGEDVVARLRERYAAKFNALRNPKPAEANTPAA